jgi:dTDP-4-dehydrorhamnose reductase
VGTGVLFTDEIRCPVPVDGLAEALVALVAHPHAGVLNVAGAEALSRYDLGRRTVRRHGLDPAAVPAGTRAEAAPQRPGVVRLDSSLLASVAWNGLGAFLDRAFLRQLPQMLAAP